MMPLVSEVKDRKYKCGYCGAKVIWLSEESYRVKHDSNCPMNPSYSNYGKTIVNFKRDE